MRYRYLHFAASRNVGWYTASVSWQDSDPKGYSLLHFSSLIHFGIRGFAAKTRLSFTGRERKSYDPKTVDLGAIVSRPAGVSLAVAANPICGGMREIRYFPALLEKAKSATFVPAFAR